MQRATLVAAIVFLCAFALPVLAQAPSPDKKPTPLVFGFSQRPDTLVQIHDGEVGLNEPVVTIPLRYERTGRLATDLVASRRIFAPHLVVAPAGSPVFMVTFNETTSTMGGRVVGRSIREMWCGVRDGPSDALEGNRGFCVEPGNSGSAFMGQQPTMIYSDRAVGRGANLAQEAPYFPRSLQIVGRRHSDVEVREGAIDLPIAEELVIAEWLPTRARILVLGSDGANRAVLDELNVAVDPRGVIALRRGGVRLELSQGAPGRFNVRTVRPDSQAP